MYLAGFRLCNLRNLWITLRTARKRNDARRLWMMNRRERFSGISQFEHRIQTGYFKNSSHKARRISEPQANSFSLSLLAQLQHQTETAGINCAHARQIEDDRATARLRPRCNFRAHRFPQGRRFTVNDAPLPRNHSDIPQI